MREEIIKDALHLAGTRFVTVTFLTKEGKERKVNGLLRPLSKMKGGTNPSVEAGYTPIWSPRFGWRCFKTSKVTKVSTDKTLILKGD